MEQTQIGEAVQKVNCQISRDIDKRLNNVVYRRKKKGLKSLTTKSQLVAQVVKRLIDDRVDETQVDIGRARRTSNRVSRNFSLSRAAKDHLERLVQRVKNESHASHFAAYGGWVEVALETYLKQYDPQSKDYLRVDDDDPEE